MLRWTAMSNYQAFRWLWRYDSDAKWFWLITYIKMALLRDTEELRGCVGDNLHDFGVGYDWF